MSIDSQIMRLLAEFEAAVRIATIMGFRYRHDIYAGAPPGEDDASMDDVIVRDNNVSEIRERFRALYAPLTASAGGKNVSK